MQIWPWWMNDPKAPADAAAPGRRRRSTISAELPPSSRCARLRCRAASSPTLRPAAVDPVKLITRTGGSVNQRLARVRATGQHVQHALGQPGLLEDPGERHAAGDRGARIGLEHHRVAERERRGDRADREDQREVERRDDADDADRHAARQAEPRLRGRHDLAERVRGERRRLVALLRRGAVSDGCLRRDRAGLAYDPLADLGGVLAPTVARPGAAPRRARGTASPPSRAARWRLGWPRRPMSAAFALPIRPISSPVAGATTVGPPALGLRPPVAEDLAMPGGAVK